MQSNARIKKSLWSWCSSLKMEHCSSVTDMDVLSLALLQQVKRTPFSLRQIWNTGRCQRIALVTPCVLYTLGRLWNSHHFAITDNEYTELQYFSRRKSLLKGSNSNLNHTAADVCLQLNQLLALPWGFSCSKDYAHAGLTQCHKKWKCCAEKNCEFIFCL